VFCVGNGVLWAKAGVGVVATQAIVDVGYGEKALDYLAQGLSPDSVVKRVWNEDPDPRRRRRPNRVAGRRPLSPAA
jgi:uncharacterized Ntn-hydrolase superfamily protein